MRPMRAASDVLADEAGRAIDAALGGPLPELVARAVVEQRVAERFVAELLEASKGQPGVVEQVLQSEAFERWLESEEAGRLVETVADRVVGSTAFRRALAAALSSPEARQALSESAGGFGADAAATARRKARAADDRIEARAHSLVGRPGAARPGYAGAATRGLALVVDAALVQIAFLLVSASVGLVLGLAGELRTGWLTGSLAGGGWLLAVTVYFAGCWSAAGKTAGQRLMGLRVVAPSGGAPSLLRSLARLVGLLLSIVTLGLGFLPAVFDDRRRALPDFLAGTTVVYD
jgi:uncharacterized RDD family membrane protein YckC